MYASSSAQLSVKSLCDRENVLTIGPAKGIARAQHSPLAPVSAVTCYPPPPHRSTYLSHAIVTALAEARRRAGRSQRRTRASNGEMQNSKRSARKAQSREVDPPMQCKRGVHAWLSRARGPAQLGTHDVRCSLTLDSRASASTSARNCARSTHTRRRTTRLQPDAVHIPLVACDAPSR